MNENTIQKIIDYFEENENIFNACIEELDSYNGYLGDSRYCEMDMLDDFYCNMQPLEILQRAYYGRDAGTYTLDRHGEKIYGEFNPNRDYFYFNGYGNLVSSDYKDYSSFLDSYVIESMLENRCYIDSIDDNEELKGLFDELEEEQQ